MYSIENCELHNFFHTFFITTARLGLVFCVLRSRELYSLILFVLMHSRKSPRASRYDYRSSWSYFVTICTQDRIHYFGEVDYWIMQLNDLGKWCEREIVDTGIRRNHIVIDEYIVMPNHIHLLIIIWEKPSAMKHRVGTYGNTSPSRNASPDTLLPPNISNRQMDALPRIPTETLWSIIRNIKSRVTKYANINTIPFERQSRYHDHIVRNQQEYDRIKRYIQQNPKNRQKDCFWLHDK